MKVVRIILLVFLALILAAGIGLIVFFKTIDLNKYLPQITAQVSRVLGREVHIDRANLAVSFNGIAVDVGRMTIGDDARFSQDVFMTVDSSHLGLELWPLIIQKEIRVASIILQSPKVQIIRSKQGLINAQTLMQPPAPVDEPTITAANPVLNKPAPVSQASPNDSPKRSPKVPQVSVKSIRIQHASIIFLDYNTEMPLNIQVPDVVMMIDDFSLNRPFNFMVEAVAYSAGTNVRAQGQAFIDLSKSTATITNLKVKTDLAALNLQAIKSITPLLAQILMPQEISGTLIITVPRMEAGALGIGFFQADIALSDGSMKFKELLSPLMKININAQMNAQDVLLSDLSFKVGAGLIQVKADLKDYLSSQVFSSELVLTDVQPQQLISQQSFPIEVKGKISAKFNLSGQGFSPKMIYRNCIGQGEAYITEGVIERLNIVKMTLGPTLSFIPGLADQVDVAMTGVFKDKLGGESTIIEKGHIKLSVKDATLFLNEAIVTTNVFELSAKGTVDYQLKMDIDTSLRITPEASATLVDDVKELGYLMGSDQRITIEGKVAGVIPQVKYNPSANVKKATQNVLIDQGVQQLQKVIEKNPQVGDILNAVFGGGSTESTDAQPATSNPADSSAPLSTEATSEEKTKKIINNVLEGIFK